MQSCCQNVFSPLVMKAKTVFSSWVRQQLSAGIPHIDQVLTRYQILSVLSAEVKNDLSDLTVLSVLSIQRAFFSCQPYVTIWHLSVEFGCSSHFYMGSLQILQLPTTTLTNRVSRVNFIGDAKQQLVAVCLCQPSDRLVTCIWPTPPLALAAGIGSGLPQT